MSCCRSPRFTLTSKGPLNYMTEPLRTFHFILSCSHALYALFPPNGFKFSIRSFFSKHQCMPSSVWHTTLMGSLQFKVIQFSCMSSWVGHTPLSQYSGGSCLHVIIVSLTHHTVCRPVQMYPPTSQASWSHQCDDMK